MEWKCDTKYTHAHTAKEINETGWEIDVDETWWKMKRTTSSPMFMSVSAAIPGSTECFESKQRTHFCTQIECKALFLFLYMSCPFTQTECIATSWSRSYSMNPNSLEPLACTFHVCLCWCAFSIADSNWIFMFQCVWYQQQQQSQQFIHANGWCCFANTHSDGMCLRYDKNGLCAHFPLEMNTHEHCRTNRLECWCVSLQQRNVMRFCLQFRNAVKHYRFRQCFSICQ